MARFSQLPEERTITAVQATYVGLAHRILAVLFLFSHVSLSVAQLAPPASISNTRVFKPRTPAEVKTLEDAMAAIMTVTSRELALPVVEPLYIHLHQDTNAFAASAGRSGNRLSSVTVRFAVAVAQENSFHINLERTKGRSW